MTPEKLLDLTMEDLLCLPWLSVEDVSKIFQKISEIKEKRKPTRRNWKFFAKRPLSSRKSAEVPSEFDLSDICSPRSQKVNGRASTSAPPPADTTVTVTNPIIAIMNSPQNRTQRHQSERRTVLHIASATTASPNSTVNPTSSTNTPANTTDTPIVTITDALSLECPPEAQAQPTAEPLDSLPLIDLDAKPSSAPEADSLFKENKMEWLRQRVVEEFIATEADYLRDLQILTKVVPQQVIDNLFKFFLLPCRYFSTKSSKERFSLKWRLNKSSLTLGN